MLAHPKALEIPGRDLTLHSLVRFHAESSPGSVAITATGRKPLTYRRLLTQIEDIVKTLNEAGIGRNDRVAIVVPEGPEMAVAFIAIASGATCAPLNPAYRLNEFEFYLSDLHASALIIASGESSPAIEAAQKLGIAVIELIRGPEAEAGMFKLKVAKHAIAKHCGFAEPPDLALTLHTSGTTARPKLVPLTHANLSVSAYNTVDVLELGSADRCLNLMPLFHIHGLMVVASTLAAGGSVVCGKRDLSDFFTSIAQY